MNTLFAKLELTLSEELIFAFARASGDHSPLHMDEQYARKSRFRRRVSHGMLPVVWIISTVNIKIHSIECRFLSPAFIEDRLEISLEHIAPSELKLRVVRIKDQMLLTSGVINIDSNTYPISTSDQHPAITPTKIHDQFAHNDSTIDELQIGRVEVIYSKQYTNIYYLHLAGLSLHQTPLVESLFLISAMVGMYQPGSRAIFTEFALNLESLVKLDSSICLRAIIEKITLASARVQLSLSFSVDGENFATGKAISIVSTPVPIEILCIDIRKNHASLSLHGKTAMVTGASRGIGAAAARLLAMRGAKVGVLYFQGEYDANAVTQDIINNGGLALAIKADIRDSNAVEAAFECIKAAFGSVDILVNNAVGQFSPKPVELAHKIDFQSELEVSLHGMHACTLRALVDMKKSRAGKIINIGSIASATPSSGQSVYTVAKSAMVGYTRALAAELASDNIQVNIVLPAMTDTSLLLYLPRSLVIKTAQETPRGKILDPIDVAKVICMLCSADSDCISGQQIAVGMGDGPYL